MVEAVLAPIVTPAQSTALQQAPVFHNTTMSTVRLPAKGIVSFQRTTRATRAAPASGRVASARATRLMTRCQVLCAQTVRAVVPLLE